MKKLLTLLVLGMFAIGCSVPAFAETTNTNSKPQRSQFENGQGVNKGINMNGENGQKGQFDGRRPKYKPDSQPGGKMEPKEWDSSSNNRQGQPPQMDGGQGQNFQGGQPPEMKEGLKNGLKEGLKNGLVNGNKKSE